MRTVLTILGVWTLLSLGVVGAFSLFLHAARRDRLRDLQERCTYHEWVRDPRGAMVCRRCEWIAGQRAALSGIEGCDGF